MERMYESEAIKTKIAFFPLEGCTIELVQPMDPASPAAKFIQKRGEGIHHICLGVENVEASLREFEAKGIELLNKTPRKTQDGRLIAFLNPKSTNGVLIELEQIGAGIASKREEKDHGEKRETEVRPVVSILGTPVKVFTGRTICRTSIIRRSSTIPGNIPLRGASTRRCTAAPCGRCGSIRASRPRTAPTSGSSIC